MNRLVAAIRWRLVAWTLLTLAVILVLLGGAIYVALSRSLLEEVDRNLLVRSEQAGPMLFGPALVGQGAVDPGGVPRRSVLHSACGPTGR